MAYHVQQSACVGDKKIAKFKKIFFSHSDLIQCPMAGRQMQRQPIRSDK